MYKDYIASLYGRGTGHLSQTNCETYNATKRKSTDPSYNQKCEKNLLLWYPKCQETHSNFGCCLCTKNKSCSDLPKSKEDAEQLKKNKAFGSYFMGFWTVIKMLVSCADQSVILDIAIDVAWTVIDKVIEVLTGGVWTAVKVVIYGLKALWYIIRGFISVSNYNKATKDEKKEEAASDIAEYFGKALGNLIHIGMVFVTGRRKRRLQKKLRMKLI